MLGEQDFNLSGGCRRVDLGTQAGAAAVEAGGDHARVVQNQEVAGSEERRQIRKVAVGEAASGAFHGEHACGIALDGRVLGDEIGWKVEVKVGDAHRLQCRRVG